MNFLSDKGYCAKDGTFLGYQNFANNAKSVLELLSLNRLKCLGFTGHIN